MHIEDRELGVCREERRGYRAYIDTCSGEDGDGDTERAFAVPAHVVYGSYAGDNGAAAGEERLGSLYAGHGKPFS